jgi:DNA-binding HxlR family transcriptional regulator
MRTYGQFCPIAVGAEIFAERWTPLIVRELSEGSARFNDLQRGLPRIPKAILVQRLKRLQHFGVVERRIDAELGSIGYYLTKAGQDLAELAVGLGDWARRWGQAEIAPERMDPDYLLWDIHRGIVIDSLPAETVVAQVDLTGAHKRRYWLVLERPASTLSQLDPGLEIDLVVTADTMALHRVWMGELDFAKALTAGLLTLEGPANLRRDFPNWLALGRFAHRDSTAAHVGARHSLQD